MAASSSAAGAGKGHGSFLVGGSKEWRRVIFIKLCVPLLAVVVQRKRAVPSLTAGRGEGDGSFVGGSGGGAFSISR